MGERHHGFARLLHWATFLVLVAGYSLIWWREGLDDPDTRRLVLNWHATAGFTIAILALARLVSRVLGDGWIVTHDLRPAERRAANLSHALLYGALLGIPVLGWLIVSARGRPVSVFGFDLPLLIAKDRDFADVLQQWHYYAAMALLAVVAVHVLAALYHHFIRRDGVLRAML